MGSMGVSQGHELDFGLVDAHKQLGIILNAQGDLAGAEKAYREAIKMDPIYVAATFS